MSATAPRLPDCDRPAHATRHLEQAVRHGARQWPPRLFARPSVIPLGPPNMGGSITTRGGVTFIAASQRTHCTPSTRAMGRELCGRDDLPAGGQATPMTYVAGAKRTQFVVIAAGGFLAWTRQGRLISWLSRSANERRRASSNMRASDTERIRSAADGRLRFDRPRLPWWRRIVAVALLALGLAWNVSPASDWSSSTARLITCWPDWCSQSPSSVLWFHRPLARMILHLWLGGTMPWAVVETHGELWGMVSRIGYPIVVRLVGLLVTSRLRGESAAWRPED